MSNVRAVRYFLTFVLLVLVYGETGPWTTLLRARWMGVPVKVLGRRG